MHPPAVQPRQDIAIDLNLRYTRLNAGIGLQGMVNLINAVPVVTQERTVYYRCGPSPGKRPSRDLLVPVFKP